MKGVAILIVVVIAGAIGFQQLVEWSKNRLANLKRSQLAGKSYYGDSKCPFTFHLRGRDSNWTHCIFEQVIPHGSDCGPPYHYHESINVFTVLEGILHVKLDGKIDFITPQNGSVIIGPNIGHTFWNQQKAQDVRFTVKDEPCNYGVAIYENYAAFVVDGYDNDIIQLLYLLCETDIYLAGLPFNGGPFVCNWIVEPLAKTLGYKAYYPQYTTNKPLHYIINNK